LGRHSLTPLKRISSRDSKLKGESNEGFSDKDVTHEPKMVWLHLKDRLLAVITFRCSSVLILLLGFVLLRVRALTYEMPRLPTIVAKAGRKFLGLRNLLMIFLDETELLSLSFS
jgi:hypothetical protein